MSIVNKPLVPPRPPDYLRQRTDRVTFIQEPTPFHLERNGPEILPRGSQRSRSLPRGLGNYVKGRRDFSD